MIQEIRLVKHLTCQLHELDKVLYCETCAVALCPECFMDDHFGHARKNLKKVYEERKSLILTALEPFQKRIEELTWRDTKMREELRKLEYCDYEQARDAEKFLTLVKQAIPIENQRVKSEREAWRKRELQPLKDQSTKLK